MFSLLLSKPPRVQQYSYVRSDFENGNTKAANNAYQNPSYHDPKEDTQTPAVQVEAGVTSNSTRAPPP